MPATFPLDIVTPERTVFSDSVTSLRLPALDGSLGILAGHAPMLAELGVGECIVHLSDGGEERLAIAGGFVEVSRERVSLLADTAEFAAEIDATRAEAALEKAREMLQHLDGTEDPEAVAAAMRRAQNRLRIARGEH